MLKFNNTSEIEPLEGILGQERAIEAMEIGLKINNPAYNMYLAGDSGTGKTTYAMNVLNKYASQKRNHKDWCYVYNFENNREPIIISLEKGLGKIFKKDIEKLIETLLDELRDAFESEDFEIGKNQLIEEYEIEKEGKSYKIVDNSLGDFDIRFLQTDNDRENKVYSPLSIKYALQMLSEGADGNTKKEINKRRERGYLSEIR